MPLDSRKMDLSTYNFRQELEYRYRKHSLSGGSKVTWLDLFELVFGHSNISPAGARNAFIEGKKPIVITPHIFVRLVRSLRQAFDLNLPQESLDEATAWYQKADHPDISSVQLEELRQELQGFFFGSKIPRLRQTQPLPSLPKSTRIFISYKRDSQPDEQLALEIFRVFEELHLPFIDQTILIGSEWAKHIEYELGRSDFLIVFLSAQSVQSEMVEWEVATATRLALENNGRPVILPVRLNYREPFSYPLNTYLDHINWVYWENPEDTENLIDELKLAVKGQKLKSLNKVKLENKTSKESLPQPFPSAQPSLEMSEGTMDPDSAFYLNRNSDTTALTVIKRQGVTITIKGPRQMGKSSLLLHTLNEAKKIGKRTVFMDFQRFDKTALENPENFFRQFCAWLGYALKIEDQLEKYWRLPMGNILRCTEYIGDYLLPQVNGPLVLGLDEVDKLFDTSFRIDFFGMLRSWHNDRTVNSSWKKLDLILVTSTEPYYFIENLNQSPFNVGEILELDDFTSEEFAKLNKLHGSPLDYEDERRMQQLLGGHPYLVRRMLYLIASGRISIARLYESAIEDRGPFGDHLRHHLFQLHNRPELLEGMKQVLKNNTCQEDIFFRLRGVGLVKRQEKVIVARNELYNNYFKVHLQ